MLRMTFKVYESSFCPSTFFLSGTYPTDLKCLSKLSAFTCRGTELLCIYSMKMAVHL